MAGAKVARFAHFLSKGSATDHLTENKCTAKSLRSIFL
jgi:hypothetical protein